MKKKPLVVVDARMVGERVHGIAKYVSHIAEGLSKKPSLCYDLCFLHGLSENFFGFKTEKISAPFLSILEFIEIPHALRTLNADLYHSPSFSSLWRWPPPPCPWMITLHDLNHLQYGNFSKKIYYEHVLKPFAKKAQKILTVSQFSQQEIALWLACEPEEIAVVPNALDSPNFSFLEDGSTEPAVLARFGLHPQKYFFSLSNSKPHKNLDFLCRAYKNYRETQRVKGSDLWPLVLSLPESERPRLENTEGVVFTDYLQPSEVQLLLFHCAGLFFPSLYEGFGRPPLEAALLGVPIVISRIPPHEEVLDPFPGHPARFLNPSEEKEWEQAFKDVQEGKIHRFAILQRQDILAQYSIENLATDMDRWYRTVLGLE